jgi:anti-sigma B factor antagonist
MLRVRLELRGGALVITPVVRRLDAAAASEFVETVREHVRERSRAVVALEHVDAVDASGVAALLAILKAMPPGGTLHLAGARPAVRTLLEATFLDRLLPTFDDVPTALQDRP